MEDDSKDCTHPEDAVWWNSERQVMLCHKCGTVIYVDGPDVDPVTGDERETFEPEPQPEGLGLGGWLQRVSAEMFKLKKGVKNVVIALVDTNGKNRPGDDDCNDSNDNRSRRLGTDAGSETI